MKPKQQLVEHLDNEIIFHSLSNPKVISEFVEIILSKQHEFNRNLILNFRNVKAAFPNVCVPISAYAHDLKLFGYHFDFYYLNEYLKKVGLQNAFLVSQASAKLKWLDRIWLFENSNDVNLIIQNYIAELSKEIVGEKGVLEGLEWALGEVAGNVLTHSMKNYGFVMGQIHSDKRIAITVFDTGIGIYSSLLKSHFKPKSPSEALAICIKKGVTRDKKEGQGFGLYGLAQIVRENAGHLTISSNSATYWIDAGKENTLSNQPALPIINGTLVDFQINYTKEIPLKIPLDGYEPVNLRMEKLENESGRIIYKVRNQPSGTSTRPSGKMLRNEVINIYKQTQKPVFIDFEGINIVASSFADEFIGKMVTEFGFVGFNNIIKLINLNPAVQSIVQRSVAQRMNDEFNS